MNGRMKAAFTATNNCFSSCKQYKTTVQKNKFIAVMVSDVRMLLAFYTNQSLEIFFPPHVHMF